MKNIITWIQNYFLENGDANTKAVIGISGGKDSTVAAALCAKALGPDRVIGVLMPNGEQHDIDVAKKVCEYLKIQTKYINIKDITDTFYESVGDAIKNNHIVKTNTPARIRMSILYAVAAVNNGRVVCTDNKSESAIGYSTKWGDNVGDFAPLLDLTATEVVELGRKLELPNEFIYKAPEDGMTGLTDEEVFGFTYKELDNYLDGKEIDFTSKQKILSMQKKSNHKRCSVNIPSYKKATALCTLNALSTSYSSSLCATKADYHSTY